MTPEYFDKYKFNPKLESKPHENLGLIVVIPSFNEPNLKKSLESIANCKLPNCSVEVIVVVNYPIGSSSEIIENAISCVNLISEMDRLVNNPNLRFYSILASDLPIKQAGVGLARKTGMDEASWRLYCLNNPKGVIACYDADSNCMDNYLIELEKLWANSPKTNACSIRYEHPTHGDEFESSIYKGITQYELHLRYYNQASRFINFPFAYHTIGSSMACCAESYVKFGGMNRHKAGEDFYFLQKIIPHGNFAELNSTCIFPSPRPSNRVPFGTGRAMLKYQQGSEEDILTYDFNSWLTLVPLFSGVEFIFSANSNELNTWTNNLHPALKQFLLNYDFNLKIDEIKSNTSSLESFRKRFFFWFDAFMLLKYLNFAHENYFHRKPVNGESIILAKEIGLKLPQNPSSIDLLKSYREKDYQG